MTPHDRLLGGTERPRHGTTLIGGAIGLLLLVAGLAAQMLYTERQSLEAEARLAAVVVAERLAERIGAAAMVADAVALDVLPELYFQFDRVPSASLDQRLTQRVAAVPGISGLAIYSQTGAAISSSRGANFDPAWVPALYDHHRDGWQILGLWGQQDLGPARPRLTLSRAALTDDGALLGVVVISMDLDRAREDVMSSLDGLHTRVTVSDGTSGRALMQMRGAHAQDAATAWLTDAALQGLRGDDLTLSARRIGEVVVASALTHDFPLTVYAQTEQGPFLAPWTRLAWLVGVAIAALTLLVLLFVRLWHSEEKARHLAQSRLLASDQRLRFAMEGSRFGLWDWGLETGEAYYSEHCLSMLGYTADTWPPTLAEQRTLVHPEDLPQVITAVTSHTGGAAGGFATDCRVRRADGSWAWMQIRGRVVDRESDGAPLRIIGTLQDISARKAMEQELQQAASIDPMLGIRNRRSFDQATVTLLARADRHDVSFALVMIDLDHFKAVNDTHGHDGGDEALRTLCRALTAALREHDRDMLFRLGGEEFCVLLADAGEDDAVQAAERLREAVAATPVTYGEAVFPLTASFGVSAHRRGERDVQDVMRRADWALYEAKNSGRNRVCRYRVRHEGPVQRHGHLTVVSET